MQRALRGAMPDTHIVWGPSLSPADSTSKEGCRQGLHGDLCGGGTGEDRLMIAPDPPGKASQTTVWGIGTYSRPILSYSSSSEGWV